MSGRTRLSFPRLVHSAALASALSLPATTAFAQASAPAVDAKDFAGTRPSLILGLREPAGPLSSLRSARRNRLHDGNVCGQFSGEAVTILQVPGVVP